MQTWYITYNYKIARNIVNIAKRTHGLVYLFVWHSLVSGITGYFEVFTTHLYITTHVIRNIYWFWSKSASKASDRMLKNCLLYAGNYCFSRISFTNSLCENLWISLISPRHSLKTKACYVHLQDYCNINSRKKTLTT